MTPTREIQERLAKDPGFREGFLAGYDHANAASALSFHRFEGVLRKHGIVDPAALDDPDGYDNYRTHGAVHAAHRDLCSQDSNPTASESDTETPPR